MTRPTRSLKRATSSTTPAQPFELNSLLGYRLLRLSSLIGSLAQQDSQQVAGLSLPEYRVLVVLRSQGPAGVSALQQYMLIDKAWISRTLTSLVAKKFVSSRPDENDARRTLFQTTAKGQKAADALIVKAHARQKRILHGLSTADLQNLRQVLSRIQANVEADGPRAPASEQAGG